MPAGGNGFGWQSGTREEQGALSDVGLCRFRLFPPALEKNLTKVVGGAESVGGAAASHGVRHEAHVGHVKLRQRPRKSLAKALRVQPAQRLCGIAARAARHPHQLNSLRVVDEHRLRPTSPLSRLGQRQHDQRPLVRDVDLRCRQHHHFRASKRTIETGQLTSCDSAASS